MNSDSEKARTAEEIASGIVESLTGKFDPYFDRAIRDGANAIESYAAERVREAEEEIGRLSAALKDQCTAIEKSAIEKARADGYKAGQEDMRELIAKKFEQRDLAEGTLGHGLAENVRSLSIEAH